MLTLTIGRDASNSIVLNENDVSRQHARLTILDDGRVLLQDLNSRNGTYVNGNRINEAYLNRGDVVKCGDAFLNWSQFTGGPVPPLPEDMPEPAPQEMYPAEEAQVFAHPEPTSLKTVFQYLTSRVFSFDDLLKTEWNMLPVILFFCICPWAISLIIAVYDYSNNSFDAVRQVIIPFFAAILIYGAAQLLTILVLSARKNIPLLQKIFVASVYAFLGFLLYFTVYFISYCIRDNISNGRNAFLLHSFFSLLQTTLLACIAFTLIIFLYRFFRRLDFSKESSVYLTIMAITLNIFLQVFFTHILSLRVAYNILNF